MKVRCDYAPLPSTFMNEKSEGLAKSYFRFNHPAKTGGEHAMRD